jgi:alginate O-acetyltransferase complex protein AlgJ
VSVSESDPVYAEAESAHRKRRPRKSVFVLVLAVVFFFGPGVAYLAGVRPQQIENRPLTKFPSIHDGWKAVPELGTWATDHLAGRKQAVSANQAVAEHVFKEQSSNLAGNKTGQYSQVIQGRDGWLFLGDDVSVRCKSRAVPADQVARMKRLSQLVTQSGRKFVIMIAPDKSSVYPQYLPKAYVGRDCAPAFTDRFWTAFAKNPTPGYVDARSPLIAAAKQSADPLYRPKDTHWDAEGISIEAQLLGDALDPGLRRGTHVVDAGTYSIIGDLTYLLGNPQKDVLPARNLVRDGVTLAPGSDLRLVRNVVTKVRNTTTDAPLYQPKTLLLGDSFTDTSRVTVAKYFADLELLHNRSNMSVIANAMVSRDTIVLQMGERLAITGNNLLLSDAALNLIAKTLAAHPIKK